MNKTELEERFGVLVSQYNDEGEKIPLTCKVCGNPAHEECTFDGIHFFCIEHFEEGLNAYKEYFIETTGQNPEGTMHCQAKDLKENVELTGFTEWDLNTLKGKLGKAKLKIKYCHNCSHREVCDARKAIRSTMLKFYYWGYTDHVDIWVGRFLGNRCEKFHKKEREGR
jgi:hypothetical protein